MKALIAMSGGVDSSVAALLMQQKGYETVGVTMKLYDNEDIGMCNVHTCCSLKDIEDARAVATTLGMPYYVMNFQDGFNEKIIEPFSRTYLHGATPNPCIDCNRYMKFGALLQRAKELGCEKAVTGHYARIEQDPETGKYLLKKAIDPKKDQSYVLYFLSQEQLAFLDFPLGGLEKTAARDLAEEHNLINARKHDSQDICFVPDGNYSRVIDEYLEAHADEAAASFNIPDCHVGPGDFVDLQGNVLGQHKGFYHYTIGQRKGLGISAKEPLYVVKIEPKENRVVLGSNDDLFKKEVSAVQVHWINEPEEGTKQIRCAAKIRYQAKEVMGTAEILEKAEDGYLVIMHFDEAVRAATKGQSLVFYDGDICLGGGIISE